MRGACATPGAAAEGHYNVLLRVGDFPVGEVRQLTGLGMFIERTGDAIRL